MQRDDPAAFFWRMSPAIERGRCVYHIATAGKPIEPSNGWPDTDAERSAEG